MITKSVLVRPQGCAPGRVSPLAPLATPLSRGPKFFYWF